MRRPLLRLRPVTRKVLADLIGNKIRTILVIASITVGVFAVGMISSAYAIIPSDMNASYLSANPANIKITTAPFDTDLLDSIARLEGVAKVQGSRSMPARLQVGDGEWAGFTFTALSDFSAGRINGERLIEGSAEPQEQQVVLEKRTAEKYGFHTGDVLTVELADGALRQLTVAGVSQDLTSGIGGMFDDPRGLVVYDTLEWLHVPAYYNQLLVTLSQGQNDPLKIQTMTDEVVNKLERSGREAYRTEQAEQNHHPMDSILEALLQILMVLGILIVFLSGSLISNTLTALLNQHLPQIGIMKLVGARSAQIIQMYLKLILAFSLISLAIAIPLGSWAGYALSDFAAGLIGFPLTGFRIIPGAIIIQTLIAILVPLLTALLPVLNGARVTVHQAIHGGSMPEGKANAQEKRSLIRMRGISRVVLVSIRNTFRHRGRLALTLLTLTLGGAIFISVFNVQVSLNHKINQITKYFSADVNLDFNRAYPVEEIQMVASQIPGIARIEPWAVTQGEVLAADNASLDNVTLLAPPVQSPLVKPIVLQGRWMIPGDQNAITINDAFHTKYPQYGVGSTLRLKLNDRKVDFTVVGIFQFTGRDDLILYTDYDSLSLALNSTGRTASYRIEALDRSLAGQLQLTRQVDNFFRDNGYQINNVEAGGSFTRSMTDYIGILTAFLVVMALLTAVVGSIGMAGTLSMNVMERTREIGVLRAIGAYNRVILRLVLLEGLIIGVISFVFSSLISFPITRLLSELISLAIFNAPADAAFTLQGFLIWLGVVVGLSIVASLIPAQSASRMTIREVLAYE